MAATPVPTQTYRDLVEKAYRTWNPEKLSDVDKLMVKYEGREPDCFDAIVRKYVFMVKPLVEYQVLHAEMLARFEPAKLSELTKQLQKHRGREAELYRQFCDTYLPRLAEGDARLNLGQGENVQGPETTARVYKGLVEKAYKRWNPAKVADVEKLMVKYEGRENDLLDQIMRKYVFAARRPLKEFQPFFAEFVARFAPEKTIDIDRLLQEYKGKEAELHRSLCDTHLPCKGASGQDAASGSSSGKQEDGIAQVAACFSVIFKEQALGLALRGATVIKAPPGEQAALLGIEVGFRLLSLGEEEVPQGQTDDQLREWVMCIIKGSRPLSAQFSREVAAEVSKAAALTEQAQGINHSTTASSDDMRQRSATAASEHWQDPSAHLAGPELEASDDDDEEPAAIGGYRDIQGGKGDFWSLHAQSAVGNATQSDQDRLDQAREKQNAASERAVAESIAVAEQASAEAAAAEERMAGMVAAQEDSSESALSNQAAEQAATDHATAEKAAADQAAQEQAAAEQAAAEKAVAEQAAAEQVAAAQAAAEADRLEAVRLATHYFDLRLATCVAAAAAEKAIAEQAEAEKAAAEKAAAEQAAAEEAAAAAAVAAEQKAAEEREEAARKAEEEAAATKKAAFEAAERQAAEEAAAAAAVAAEKKAAEDRAEAARKAEEEAAAAKQAAEAAAERQAAMEATAAAAAEAEKRAAQEAAQKAAEEAAAAKKASEEAAERKAAEEAAAAAAEVAEKKAAEEREEAERKATEEAAAAKRAAEEAEERKVAEEAAAAAAVAAEKKAAEEREEAERQAADEAAAAKKAAAEAAERQAAEQAAAADQAAAEEAEKRASLVKTKRVEVQDTCASASETLENLARGLSSEKWAGLAGELPKLSGADLNKKAVAVEASLKSARDSLDSAKDQIKLIRTELDVFPELIELKTTLAQLTDHAEHLEDRSRKISGLVTMAISTHLPEYEAVRMDVASKLRATAESAGKTVADLFDLVCKDGRASKADISAYLSANSCVVEAEKLDQLLERAVEDDGPADTIDRADFDRMVRVYYKVVKDTVLSDSLLIQSAKRRMVEGESLEVLEGPVMEDSCKVHRVRVLSLRDGLEGWVTIASNQGVTFLEPGGCVRKDTLLPSCANEPATKTNSFSMEPTDKNEQNNALGLTLLRDFVVIGTLGALGGPPAAAAALAVCALA